MARSPGWSEAQSGATIMAQHPDFASLYPGYGAMPSEKGVPQMRDKK